MNRKGFTLIEILAVIFVVGIVGLISFYSVFKLSDNANEENLRAKKELLIESALLYGEDNKSFISLDCYINDVQTKCMKVSVATLIENKYYTPYEKCKDTKLNNCIYNDLTKEKMDNEILIIYLKNNAVMAKFESDLDIKISL